MKTELKIRRSKRNRQFYWKVRGLNHETVCGGANEGYKRVADLVNAIKLVCNDSIICQLEEQLAALDAKK